MILTTVIHRSYLLFYVKDDLEYQHHTPPTPQQEETVESV